MARYCLSAAAQATPDKVALVVVSDARAPADRAERWTYAQLDDAVRRIATGLRQLGLEPGARLMIRMGNTSDYALLFFGAIAAGCVPLPSSAQLTGEEADFLLADSGAQALAVSGELAIASLPGMRMLGPADVATLRTRCEGLDANRWNMPILPPTIQPFSFTPPAPPAGPKACCMLNARLGGGGRCIEAGMACARTT